MKNFSHIHVCSMSTNRDHFTSHDLHLNSQGKNWIINKQASIITSIISKSRAISVTPLPWLKKSNKSYDDHKHRKELVTEGINMPKEKVFKNQSAWKLKKTGDQRNSLSKEEIFYNVPELEVGREYRQEEGIIKETPGSPTSKTNEQCKRLVEEDATYIVPKMDVTYSLREEEDKEEETNVMPSSGTIRKSNRIKNPPSAKLDDFFMVNLNQNDNTNPNRNFSSMQI